MKTLMTLLAVAAIAACGDNNTAVDSAVHTDSSNLDAVCSNCPSVPALGVQIDRLGRPAINTALNHGFDGSVAAGPAKDAYNQDQGVGSWPATYTAQFGLPLIGGTSGPSNLGIIDVLDTGLTCTSGVCTADAGAAPGAGCGNQVLYNGNAAGGGTPTATSYMMLAGILADDQLYLDTTQKVCDLASHANYLAVEFNVVTGVGNTTCGGRAPTNDVMDTTYTAVAIGIQGFTTDGQFTPAFGDGVGPHADTNNDTFPFLGAPH